jgi:hypothetical protein
MKSRQQELAQAGVRAWANAVQVIDIDVVGLQAPQAGLKRLDDIFGIERVGVECSLFRGDHDAIPRDFRDRAAHDFFGAVSLRGVDEVDAEVERGTHQMHGSVSAY